MDILKHIPQTESWRREEAEKFKALWFMGFSYGHEIPLPDDPEEAREIIESTLSSDAPHIDLAEAREAVQVALEGGPLYRQNVMCIAFDEEGEPSVLYV